MKNRRTRQKDSEQHHTNSKKKSFPSTSEARKVLESGGPIDDEEVKEIFDDEAISRKLNDLRAYLFTVEEPKEAPMPEILFMRNRTHWKICLCLKCQQRSF